MFANILRTLRTVAIIILSLLCFQIIIDLIQAHQVLQNVHPVLGTLFALTLVAAGTALVIWYIVSLKRHPLTLRPPPRQELDKANTQELRAYGRYLRRVMQRLVRNELLPEVNRVDLESEAMRLREALTRKSDITLLSNTIRDAEELRIQPAIKILDKLAEKEVRHCVRDIMLGITLSPWRTVDLLVVLYRNMGMVVRITGIYSNKPRLREHFLILRDVITVVATVNLLNYGSKLMNNLLSSVPFLGRFTDDIAQGVGAGLMTSVTGHVALMRCRAFRGWSDVETQNKLRNQLGLFMVDIKKIVFDDVLPQLRKPVEALSPEAAREPGWMDRLRKKVADAIDDTIDDTIDGMDSFIKQPVVAAGRGVAKTGSVIAKSTKDSVQTGRKSILIRIRKAGKALGSKVKWW